MEYTDEADQFIRPGDKVSPAARVHIQRNKIFTKYIQPSGKGKFITKMDVLKYLKNPTYEIISNQEDAAEPSHDLVLDGMNYDEPKIKQAKKPSSVIPTKLEKEDKVVKIDKNLCMQLFLLLCLSVKI